MTSREALEKQAARLQECAASRERHAFTPSQLRSLAADYDQAAALWLQAHREDHARHCRNRAAELLARGRAVMMGLGWRR